MKTKVSKDILTIVSSEIDGSFEISLPQFVGYSGECVREALADIRVYRGGTAERTQTHRAVAYLPQYQCLFDSEGNRIEQSCRPDKIIDSSIPKKVDLSKVELKDRVGSFVFGGFIPEHFGHFLTEGLSRIGSSLVYEEKPVFTISRSPLVEYPPFVDVCFKHANVSSSRLFSCVRPTLFEEVVVPYPSFRLGRYAYRSHLVLPRLIAESICGSSKMPNQGPLYLSRRKLTKDNRLREVLREDELEHFFRNQGVAIAYPETLSFEEQVRLVNSHESVIGVCGSALHLQFFSLRERPRMLCIGDVDRIDRNFLLMDALLSADSVYVAGLLRDHSSAKEMWQQDREIDIEAVLAAIEGSGSIF